SNKETRYGTGKLGSEGNILLAEARAQAAYDYLTQNMGVPPELIQTIGMGTNPAPKGDGSSASNNQRVEVQLEVNDF
ncbi:MAG: OmpA family protein, partial [Bacteroidales bacterium]|nr:OmpA family protein [Bacteroidales bacterium]